MLTHIDGLALDDSSSRILASANQASYGTRYSILLKNGGHNLCYGDCAQRRTMRRLPNCGVPSSEGEREVPSVLGECIADMNSEDSLPSIDSYRKIERREHANHTQWVRHCTTREGLVSRAFLP